MKIWFERVLSVLVLIGLARVTWMLWARQLDTLDRAMLTFAVAAAVFLVVRVHLAYEARARETAQNVGNLDEF